jgi:hypothetical protein
MWTAIGVGILVVSQAAALPAGRDAKTRPVVAESNGSAEPALPGAENGTTLYFRNDVGNRFNLVQARFSLDGRDLPAVITRADQGQDYIIFTGHLAPGRHVVTSHVTYQGRSVAVFTYMKGYTFNLDTTNDVEMPATGSLTAVIVGHENKGFNVPFEQSLGVALEEPLANNTALSVSNPPRAR